MPRELPLVRIGGPATAPHLRLAPRTDLAHAVETRTADAILARALIEDGTLSEAEALAAEATARELDLPLARILLTRGRVDEGSLLGALATVHDAPVLSLSGACPDPRLARVVPRDLALGRRPCLAIPTTALCISRPHGRTCFTP
jgi:hypothetical protein